MADGRQVAMWRKLEAVPLSIVANVTNATPKEAAPESTIRRSRAFTEPSSRRLVRSAIYTRCKSENEWNCERTEDHAHDRPKDNMPRSAGFRDRVTCNDADEIEKQQDDEERDHDSSPHVPRRGTSLNLDNEERSTG